MKSLRSLVYVVLLSAFCSASAFAAVKPKTELTFFGAYSHPEGQESSWRAGSDVLFPLGTGIVVLGPSVVVSDDDSQTAGGAVLEINVPGQSGGFFFGGQALYYLDSEEGQDSTGVGVRAGIKLPVSKSGLFKVYLEQGVSGRGESEDITGVLAAAIKF